jgi:hypothetical protein
MGPHLTHLTHATPAALPNTKESEGHHETA